MLPGVPDLLVFLVFRHVVVVLEIVLNGST